MTIIKHSPLDRPLNFDGDAPGPESMQVEQERAVGYLREIISRMKREFGTFAIRQRARMWLEAPPFQIKLSQNGKSNNGENGQIGVIFSTKEDRDSYLDMFFGTGDHSAFRIMVSDVTGVEVEKVMIRVEHLPE